MNMFRWAGGILLLIAIGCNGSGPDPAVKRDLARYKAQMASIAPLEDRATEANTRATGEPGTNDATYARALRETIIPDFEAFGANLVRIRPLTEPVIELQRIYLRRIASVISGFKDLEKAARTSDKALVDQATAKFNEGKALYKVWSAKREALEKQF